MSSLSPNDLIWKTGEGESIRANRFAEKDPIFPTCEQFSRIASNLRFARFSWAAANGGVTNGGLRGVWLPFLEISRNRPKSPFFCLFRPFPEGPKSTREIQKTEEKGLFPQISSDFLKPPSLKPPFAAPQISPPKTRFAKKGFSSGTLKRFVAIRANLRIDSRESRERRRHIKF